MAQREGRDAKARPFSIGENNLVIVLCKGWKCTANLGPIPQRAARESVWAFRGTQASKTNRRPLQLLNDVVNGLALHVHAAPLTTQAILIRMKDDAAVLVESLPGLVEALTGHYEDKDKA